MIIYLAAATSIKCFSIKKRSVSSSVKVIPFKFDQKDARGAFDKFHNTKWWLYRAVTDKIEQVEELFLPFWNYNGSVTAKLESAQIGEIRWTPVYNPTTKRTELKQQVHWKSVSGSNILPLKLEFSPGVRNWCQIYASFHYNRSVISSITPKESEFNDYISKKENWSRDVLKNLQTPRVEPFQMSYIEAKSRAQSLVSKEFEQLFSRQLSVLYRVPHVRYVNVSILDHASTFEPVYYPVFLFKQRYMGKRVRTFVNGAQINQVGGFHAYNPISFALGGAVGGFLFFPYPIVNALAVGGALGAAIAVYLPLFQIYYGKWRRRIDSAKFEQPSSKSNQEYDQYYKTYSSRSTSSSSNTRTASVPSDPKGYYRALNVSNQASQEEIQSAFRGLALKWHPDKYTSPRDKQRAKEEFQKLSEAYTVLKNAEKRELYDKGIRV